MAQVHGLVAYRELNPREVGWYCNLWHFCQTYVLLSILRQKDRQYFSLAGDIVFHAEDKLLKIDCERDPP